MSDARAQFLAALAKFQPRPVEIPELGGTVYLRPFTVLGMQRFHAAQEAKTPERAALIMLIDCIVDEAGKPILTEADAELINSMPSKVADAIYLQVTAINGLGDKAAQDDAAGN